VGECEVGNPLKPVATEGTLRRVTPKLCGDHGCQAVGLHHDPRRKLAMTVT